jgi:hypothetical protein
MLSDDSISERFVRYLAILRDLSDRFFSCEEDPDRWYKILVDVYVPFRNPLCDTNETKDSLATVKLSLTIARTVK